MAIRDTTSANAKFMSQDPLSASDGFAIAMLSMILLSMSVIVMLLVCMFRSAARRDPQVDQLLDEVEEESKKENLAGTTGEAAPEKQPWEKDANWWKP